jgi:hypothetical protein
MHTAALDSFVLQTLFPLLYLLLKRHYDIMRIMRTKVLNMRELLEGSQGILYINDAVVDRVQGLTRMSVSPSTVGYFNLIYRQLHSAETRSREAVSELRFWDCGLFIFFSGSHYLLTCLSYSSNITIISILYGLRTMSVVLILKSHHTTTTTRIKMSNLGMF